MAFERADLYERKLYIIFLPEIFYYNEVLKAFHRYSKYYPVLLLFSPLVFYYPEENVEM